MLSPFLQPRPNTVENDILASQRISKLISDLESLGTELTEKWESKLKEIAKAAQNEITRTQALLRINKGNPGSPGKDGRTPQKGVDYFDAKDLDEDTIIEKILSRIPIPKNGASADPDTIKRAVLAILPFKGSEETPELDIEKIFGVAKLKFEHLDPTLATRIKNLEYQSGARPYLHGGGDTVAAGVNVTITSVNGKKVISAGAAGGYQVPTSGVVDGSNKTFVWATAPNVIVLDNGNAMNKVSSDNTVNWTGTTTTVLTQAPNFNIYATA